MSKIDELMAKHCPNGVRFFPLGEVISLEYGKPLKKENQKKGDYPVFGSNGIIGFHNEYVVEGPCIIVGRKGSAGKVTFSEKNAFPIDTTFFVKLKDENTDLKFIYYLLKKNSLKALSNQTGVPGLNRNDAYEIKIPIPPREVQEEIVRILDSYTECEAELRQQLEAEVAARRSQYEYCRNALLGFEPSAIKNHPLKNLINRHCPNGVRFFTLGELMDKEIISHRNGTGINETTEAGIPYVKVSDMNHPENQNKITTSFNFVSKNYKSKNLVKVGSIIFPKVGQAINTNKKKITGVECFVDGNTAIVEILDKNILDNLFLYHIFLSIPLKSMCADSSDYPSINKEGFSKVKIPVPPREVQEEIVRILDSYTQCEAELRQQLEAEVAARRSQYEYCRNKLLTFEENREAAQG